MKDLLPSLPALFDSMDDFVLVKGPRSKLLWANRSFCTFYGLTNEQLESLVDAEHSDPDDTVQYVRDDRHVFTTGEVLVVEEPVTRADGVVKYYRTTKSACRCPSTGEIIGTIGISRPIEADATNQELRSGRKERLQYLRTLTSSLPVPLAMFDMQGRLLSSSARFNDLIGWETELSGFAEALLDNDPTLVRAITRVIRDATDSNDQDVQIAAGGWADVHAVPWFLDQAQGGALLLLNDTTALRANERRLAAANTDLQASNAALSEFAFIASHDLNEPARMVNSYAQLLTLEYSDRLPVDGQQYLAFVQEGAARMMALVRDVLELSRRGSERLEVHPVSLHALVADALGDLRDSIEPDRVDVPDDTVLRCDPGQMRLVFVNLLGNAFKFRHPDREPRVWISTRRHDDQLSITFKDNGLGIEPRFHDTVFRMFARLHRRRDYDGTGIGLTLCRRVAERHGGTLTVDSELGSGSAFTVTLPLE